MRKSFGVIVAIALAGCLGRGQEAGGSTPSSATVLRACPLGVPSAHIDVVETADGTDLELFATLPSHVTELRRRVRDQTHAHGPGHHDGLGHAGRHGLGHEHGLRLWTLPPLRATVYDAPAGARLALVPIDPRDRAALRDAVAKRVAYLEGRGCPD
jgi:hypothetical protein